MYVTTAFKIALITHLLICIFFLIMINYKTFSLTFFTRVKSLCFFCCFFFWSWYFIIPFCDYVFQISETEIDILVAVVKYKTKLVKPRQGVCSNWIAIQNPEEFPDVCLPVWIKPGSFILPSDPDIPVIMVGPGKNDIFIYTIK